MPNRYIRMTGERYFSSNRCTARASSCRHIRSSTCCCRSPPSGGPAAAAPAAPPGCCWARCPSGGPTSCTHFSRSRLRWKTKRPRVLFPLHLDLQLQQLQKGLLVQVLRVAGAAGQAPAKAHDVHAVLVDQLRDHRCFHPLVSLLLLALSLKAPLVFALLSVYRRGKEIGSRFSQNFSLQKTGAKKGAFRLPFVSCF